MFSIQLIQALVFVIFINWYQMVSPVSLCRSLKLKRYKIANLFIHNNLGLIHSIVKQKYLQGIWFKRYLKLKHKPYNNFYANKSHTRQILVSNETGYTCNGHLSSAVTLWSVPNDRYGQIALYKKQTVSYSGTNARDSPSQKGEHLCRVILKSSHPWKRTRKKERTAWQTEGQSDSLHV